MPSTLVRVIHRSCRMVAESSTTSSDLSIGASLWYAQQIHKAFDCPELSICHRIKFRADQCARRMTGEQFEELMIQGGESPLVRQQRINRYQTNHSFLDFKWYACANFLTLAFTKVRLSRQGNDAFKPFSQRNSGPVWVPCRLTFIACAYKFVTFIVDHKKAEIL